jgi:hypothetical protein
MNEFEILIRHFLKVATHPSHSRPGYHEIGRWAGFMVHNQISRSERQVNMSRRAGALLNVAAKLPDHPGPEAATVAKRPTTAPLRARRGMSNGKGTILSDA